MKRLILLLLFSLFYTCFSAFFLGVTQNEVKLYQSKISESYKSRLQLQGGTKRKVEPIVFIPGATGSALKMKMQNVPDKRWYCSRKSNKYFHVWLNLIRLLPIVSNCLLDNFQIQKKDGRYISREGITIKPITGLKGVKILEPRFPVIYFKPMLDYLKQFGYVEEKNIKAAPYDWRFGPSTFKEKGNYYDILKKIIEDTYEQNEKQKVHLISHSMGSPTTNVFLSQFVTPEWREKHIASHISLGGAFDGSIAIPIIVSQGSKIPTVDKMAIRNYARTSPGAAWLFPTRENQEEPLIITKNRNYTYKETKQYLEDMGIPHFYEMMQEQNKAGDKFADPKVPMYCIYGNDFPTAKTYIIENIHEKSKVERVMGLGDHTISKQSLEQCSKLPNAKTFTFKDMHHVLMMFDPRMWDIVLDITTKEF